MDWLDVQDLLEYWSNKPPLRELVRAALSAFQLQYRTVDVSEDPIPNTMIRPRTTTANDEYEAEPNPLAGQVPGSHGFDVLPLSVQDWLKNLPKTRLN